MSRVKRAEAQGILSELKAFAFEGNEDFRNGALMAIETQKTFHFPPDPVFRGTGDFPHRRSILTFQASRVGEKIRNIPAYVYDLSATAMRSIAYIPATIFDELDEDDRVALEVVEAGALSEAYTTSFSASNHEIGEIEVVHSYTMMHRGDSFFGLSNMEVVNTNEGDLEDVPEEETIDSSGLLYIPDKISDEQLPDQVDRLLNDLAFRAIVDPFCDSPELGVANFRESVGQMRAIMDGLRSGLNIHRLYELNPPGLTVKSKEER